VERQLQVTKIVADPPIFRSVLFNGSTQYLTASTNAGLNPDYNTAFWLSFWIKSSQAGQPTLLSNLDVGGKGLYVLLDGGKMEVHLYDALEAHASSVKTTTSVNDGSYGTTLPSLKPPVRQLQLGRFMSMAHQTRSAQ
jgi:hypothetical protein